MEVNSSVSLLPSAVIVWVPQGVVQREKAKAI